MLRRCVITVYIEIDNAYKVNEVIGKLEDTIPQSFTYQILAPKSGNIGNTGISIVIDKRIDIDVLELSKLDNIVFALEE